VAEEALRKSEEKLRNILENVQDIIFQLTPEGFIQYVSPNLEILYGYDPKNLIGKHFSETTPETEITEINEALEKVLQGKTVRNMEIKQKSSDGTITIMETTISPVKKQGKIVAVQGIMRDITDRKKAEEERRKIQEQLNRMQKMDSLGALAGAVAHDLNHILAGLVTYPDLLLREMKTDDPLRQKIESIKESGQRAAAIVDDLLNIARGGITISEVVNVNDVITECLESPEIKLLQKNFSNVSIEIDLDPDLHNILSSKINVLKILYNLINNGVEAMPHGGVLLISTSNKKYTEPGIGYEVIAPGDYVELQVLDTGTGIDQNDLSRIFEPYFTKKVLGRSGTGIGLAVLWSIVKDHNGFVDVKSEIGKGTTFSIYIPVTSEKVDVKKRGKKAKDLDGSGEKLLLVDDEKELRTSLSEILRSLNYNTSMAASGEEALEYLSKKKVDLILLDMFLGPGIDGLETLKRIKKIIKSPKVIIISGYSSSEKIMQTEKLSVCCFIKKPFTIDELGSAIKKALKNPQS